MVKREKYLTDTEKVILKHFVEAGRDYNKAAQSYGCSPSRIYAITSKKKELVNAYCKSLDRQATEKGNEAIDPTWTKEQLKSLYDSIPEDNVKDKLAVLKTIQDHQKKFVESLDADVVKFASMSNDELIVEAKRLLREVEPLMQTQEWTKWETCPKN